MYKVNDIVVVTERYSNNSAKIGITGILKKIDSLKPKFCIRNKSKDVFDSYCQEVRKATIPEVEQYVKDNNCDINEILEICKNLYPQGTNYNCLHEADEKFSNGEFEIALHNSHTCIRTNNGCKCCYDTGKFAQIISQQEELPFKVGDKFYYYTDNTPRGWTITNIEGIKVYIDNESVSTRSIDLVKDLVLTGKWLPLNPQLKKEDFYNTKIDVSESEELSRLVQEKLFELGFIWSGSGKVVINYQDIIYISNKQSFNLLFSGSNTNRKQIYPQDLGININNQTINNNNNVNKENISKENYSGRSIEVRRPTPTISTGQRRSGSSIQGKESKLRFTSGHLSHRARIGN